MKRLQKYLVGLMITLSSTTSIAFASNGVTPEDLANDPLKWQKSFNNKGIFGPLHNLAGELGVEFYQFLFLVALILIMCALVVGIGFFVVGGSQKGSSFGKTTMGKAIIAIFLLFAIPAVVALIAAVTSMLNQST